MQRKPRRAPFPLIALILIALGVGIFAYAFYSTPRPSIPIGLSNDERITAASTAIAQNPDDPLLYVTRGMSYVLIYEWDNALADYTRAIALDPSGAEAYYLRGVLYMSAPDGSAETRQKALADFERYLALQPNGASHATARRAIAQLQAALGTPSAMP
jgi:tetratricopeptide (TPR) repeat protein